MCVLLKKRSIYVVSSSVIFDYVYCFFFLDKSKRSLINRWIYVSCKERLEMHTVEIISSFIFTPDPPYSFSYSPKCYQFVPGPMSV